ncbi:MAG: general secretion pathway protein GspL [Sphingomonadales bacterium]|nr:MAG: general secretion pathway protein GspL [Sphingomonadales bacterium]
MGAPDLEAPRAGGIWTLAGDRLIIVDADGPATILVPTEQVRLLEVDLPLANRAKRLAALPFAIEDRIAEPVESVHIALGDEVEPKQYLVGVVSHVVMARWVAIAEAAGLGHAAIVPDVLSVPVSAKDVWNAHFAGGRVLVRTGYDGFAGPAALFRSAYQNAPNKGDLDVVVTGNPPPGALPDGWEADGAAYAEESVREILAKPALDLRQGLYARTNAGASSLRRRLGWIVALGAAAHILIASADMLMLRSIADRRAADTRALVAATAPGTPLGDDLVGEVTNLLPVATGAKPDAFVPLVTRVSGALAPLAGSLSLRTMNFQANTLTMDADGSEPGLATLIDAALKAASVEATVTTASDGSIRITARGA